MAPFTIDEAEFGSLSGKVVLITGGSSGIGLATAHLLQRHQAKVVVVDKNVPEATSLDSVGDGSLSVLQADVTSWKELSSAFEAAVEKWGRIDHVFANAGIGARTSYTEDVLDEQGKLKEPDHTTIQVNLIGVANTVKLAVHHLRKQADGGSIVLTASTAAYQRFSAVDYTVAKHGVLGLMRGLAGHLYPKVPIRVNSVAPGWTNTKLISRADIKGAGVTMQEPVAVARCVVLLMADGGRNQQLVYSQDNRYSEIEQDLLKAVEGVKFKESTEEEDLQSIYRVLRANRTSGSGSS